MKKEEIGTLKVSEHNPVDVISMCLEEIRKLRKEKDNVDKV